MKMFAPGDFKPVGASVLVIDLEGVILDSDDFINSIYDNIESESIKAIIVKVNSPGGVVGPSQAMYRELIRVRDEYEKPVIAYFESVAASGAYYVAAGADKIVTNPGTIVGSIGVIMDFANLEDLYSWAKIKRFSIKTGRYKDTGADYRSMRDDEKVYLQYMMDEVLEQFKSAIIEGRGLSKEVVDENADGRIFTGKRAVELGFADKLGSFSDALDLAKEMTGEKDLEVYDPNKDKPAFFKYLEGASDKISIGQVQELLRLQLFGKPLFLMPGAGL